MWTDSRPPFWNGRDCRPLCRLPVLREVAADVLEESLEEYDAVVNLERLRQRFEQGEQEVTVDYWGTVSAVEQMCVRQSFIMTRDDGTGDIMVMVVSKDITAQVQKQRSRPRLSRKR